MTSARRIRWTLSVLSLLSCAAADAVAQFRFVPRYPVVNPGFRSGHAMAYDSARKRTVLFGGRGRTLLGDTWEWDGTSWRRLTPPTSPPARMEHAMVFDEARGRVLLFGGRGAKGQPLADTWTFDGTRWTKSAPAVAPPARYGHALTYDSAREVCVLFGGYGAGFLGDTWEWDGKTWTRRSSVVSPPPRMHHALAYDRYRARTVLFGGQTASAVGSDTWEWDGTAWSQAAPKTTPEAVFGHVLVFAETRARTLLLGGYSAALGWQVYYYYEWDGLDWHPYSYQTASGFVRRFFTAAAYDRARARLVVQGGYTNTKLADTFEIEGVGLRRGSYWVVRTPTARPVARSHARMVYDEARSVVLLFGGRSARYELGDTWTWDGRTWTNKNANLNAPSSALTYDSFRKRVVLHGRNGSSSSYWTWEWDGSKWTTVSTSGGPMFPVLLAYDQLRKRTVALGRSSSSTETWEWDGTKWAKRATGVQPRLGAGAFTMAYDAGRGVVVVYEAANRETWEWNGTLWRLRMPTNTPSPSLEDPYLVYDPAGKRCLLTGTARYNQSRQRQVWYWDGTNWSQADPTNRLQTRAGSGATFDVKRRRLVVFGGWYWANNSTVYTDETWEFLAPRSYYPYGGLPLWCPQPPVLGSPLTLSFPASGRLGVLSLGTSTQAVTLTGPKLCGGSLRHIHPLFAFFTTASPASFTFPVPADPALAGAALVFQGVNLQKRDCLRATEALLLHLLPQ